MNYSTLLQPDPIPMGGSEFSEILSSAKEYGEIILRMEKREGDMGQVVDGR